MEVFETRPKQWGNSLGITIPKEIADRERLSPQTDIFVTVLNKRAQEKIKKAFGTLLLKKQTQQVMDDIDEGYD
ncbi:AbrB/MazE/SpoVT family DNA-binding domain-containing protein [Candidatus Woesearchaeota archaeon]|nr:AbrB/MazE/SpoVT family DNA-binding domain-containing protein [Candidatus Woesearchaeota archaeon]